jgi:ubiquinone/menaquinone biosynthesis C-methylase UbiE
MKWYIKAVIHKILSLTPFDKKINRFFQEYCGELRCPVIALDEIKRVYTDPIIQKFGKIADIKIVEIGTGWVPVLPFMLSLMGAKCKSFDVYRHLKEKIVLKTLDGISNQINFYPEAYKISPQILEKIDRASSCKRVDEIMEIIGVDYIAPVDTRNLPLKSESQDVTVSRLVLQHISPYILKDILKEQLRILKRGGISIHRVNLHDEYAGTDPKVTIVNFLKYPSWLWDRFGNNSIKYINRARYPYYIELFKNTGFRIVSLKKILDKRSFDALEKLNIDKEFKQYSREELATVSFSVILEKP